ncbi:MAG: hypothetical protein PHN69_03975 [Candidatus Pacebacteria bacterium]|nr:hypothetical protein [Fermentimonas sp.]MDD4804310.1 hypothetical protein [Candidatus Paceibacterota bacterium]
MVEVPFNIKFPTRGQALEFAKTEAAKFKKKPKAKAEKGRYWSNDLDAYKPTWVAVLEF